MNVLLFLSFLSFIGKTMCQIPVGFTQSEDLDECEEVAEFGVSEFAGKFSTASLQESIITVLSCYRQVVTGVNWRIEVAVNVPGQDHPEVYLIDVYENLKGEYELNRHVATKIEEKEIEQEEVWGECPRRVSEVLPVALEKLNGRVKPPYPLKIVDWISSRCRTHSDGLNVEFYLLMSYQIDDVYLLEEIGEFETFEMDLPVFIGLDGEMEVMEPIIFVLDAARSIPRSDI